MVELVLNVQKNGHALPLLRLGARERSGKLIPLTSDFA